MNDLFMELARCLINSKMYVLFIDGTDVCYTDDFFECLDTLKNYSYPCHWIIETSQGSKVLRGTKLDYFS